MTHRLVEVSPQRLPGWVDRFAVGHGGLVEVRVAPGRQRLLLTATDGALATIEVPFGAALPDGIERPASTGLLGSVSDLLAAVTDRCRCANHAFTLLVRRGGYAVGVVDQGRLVAHKVGTRYVQGRTAAGGWSQQRFARRRAGQTAGLVESAGQAAGAVLGSAPAGWQPTGVILGGDRALLEEVLSGVRLRRLAGLPRSPVLDVADPRLEVLRAAVERGCSVRVRVDDP